MGNERFVRLHIKALGIVGCCRQRRTQTRRDDDALQNSRQFSGSGGRQCATVLVDRKIAIKVEAAAGLQPDTKLRFADGKLAMSADMVVPSPLGNLSHLF